MLHDHLNSCNWELRQLSHCSNQTLMWPTEKFWLNFRQRRDTLRFSSTSLQAVGLCQSAFQWVLADVYTGGKKRPENEADHVHLVPSLRVELQKYQNRNSGRLAHGIVTMQTTLSRLRYVSIVLQLPTSHPSALRLFIS